jgi:hypothetical protein
MQRLLGEAVISKASVVFAPAEEIGDDMRDVSEWKEGGRRELDIILADLENVARVVGDDADLKDRALQEVLGEFRTEQSRRDLAEAEKIVLTAMEKVLIGRQRRAERKVALGVGSPGNTALAPALGCVAPMAAGSPVSSPGNGPASPVGAAVAAATTVAAGVAGLSSAGQTDVTTASVFLEAAIAGLRKNIVLVGKLLVASEHVQEVPTKNRGKVPLYDFVLGQGTVNASGGAWGALATLFAQSMPALVDKVIVLTKASIKVKDGVAAIVVGKNCEVQAFFTLQASLLGAELQLTLVEHFPKKTHKDKVHFRAIITDVDDVDVTSDGRFFRRHSAASETSGLLVNMCWYGSGCQHSFGRGDVVIFQNATMNLEYQLINMTESSSARFITKGTVPSSLKVLKLTPP